MKKKEINEEIERTIEIPLSEIGSVDLSNQNIEKMARGYFTGKQAIGRKKDIRKVLEDKVVGKIGAKGKFLVEKLFELIEGVQVVGKGYEEVNGIKEQKVYIRPPDLNAIIYALDRVLGRPKQLNVQANFSLSQLLIKTDGKPSNRIGPGDNAEVSEKPDLLY